MGDSLTVRAQKLRASILSNDSSRIAYEPTLFDTALVAAIQKRDTPQRTSDAVFPEALKYVLARQQADGGWTSGMEDFKLGCILNTLAGLYAILRSQRLARPSPRVSAAQKFLNVALESWDPADESSSPEQLRLVSKLLEHLKQCGMVISFARQDKLEELVQHSPQTEGSENHVLVAIVPQTKAYSVEVERHSLQDCGVGCSPAQTALAMINDDSYNDEYEAYLRSAMQATGVHGGVPAMFPMSLVEAASVLEASAPIAGSTEDLLELEAQGQSSSRPRFHLQENDLSISAHLLCTKLLGSDDTSGSYDELEQVLLDQLEAKTGSQSLDLNCHILNTLLHRPQRQQSHLSISKLFHQICGSWWDGTWNKTISRSELYAFHLFVSCFSRISEVAPDGALIVEIEDLEDRAPIVVAQMVAKILTTQNCNGSWGEGTRGCLEDTALAILSLVIVLEFSFFYLLALDIRHAIEKGRELLLSAVASGKPLKSTNSNWLSATSFRSNQRCESYVLAALSKSEIFRKVAHPRDGKAEKAYQLANSLATFFHGLPNLSKEPFFKFKAAAIESSFYVKKLKEMRLDIFPATNSKEKDKYLHYIPIMWCMENSVRRAWAPPVFIWDISVVSLFIFLVDEYMEGQTATFSRKELADLNEGIEQIFSLDSDWATEYQQFLFSIEERTNPLVIMNTPFQNKTTAISSSVSDALSVFFKWSTYLMSYPSLKFASALDLHALRVESKNYLHYHIHQTLDNQHLAAQKPFNASIPFRHPSMGYAPWVHTIGGGHIAATYALTWVQACFGNKIRGPGRDCFSSVKQKCMVWNLNSHSAKQLRMFNDYGSILRDAEERNLNSTNFPEFFGSDDSWLHVNGTNDDAEFRVQQRKAMLSDAARYERKRTEEEWDGLEKELVAEGQAGEKLARWLGLYFAGGDQFSDMYLFRDVTNSTK